MRGLHDNVRNYSDEIEHLFKHDKDIVSGLRSVDDVLWNLNDNADWGCSECRDMHDHLKTLMES